jgi:hypothetical protein
MPVCKASFTAFLPITRELFFGRCWCLKFFTFQIYVIAREAPYACKKKTLSVFPNYQG